MNWTNSSPRRLPRLAARWCGVPRTDQGLELLSSAIDRKCDLQNLYAAADDTKTRLKIAAELRLSAASIERLLRRVSTRRLRD